MAGQRCADAVLGDLAELVAGAAPGRTSATDVTLFESVGLAIEDAAPLAGSAVREAIARGIGRTVVL